MTHAEQVRREIRALTKTIDATYRRLGALLKEVRDKELWKEYGYASFEEFCEKEIGYRDRKVRYLIATVEGFERAGVTEEEAAELDASRAQTIAPVLTQQNKESWLSKAHSMPVRELRREVARSQGHAVPETAPRPWTVMLFDNQREEIEQGMVLAGKAAGTDNRGEMLVAMSREFVSTYGYLAMSPVEPAAPAEEESSG